MPVKSNLDGLKKLSKNAKELSETKQVKLNDLMNPNFITGCSNFGNLDELFDAGGFKIESKEDFEAIPDEEWDQFIVNNTSFGSWEEMQKKAVEAYAKSKLFKGL